MEQEKAVIQTRNDGLCRHSVAPIVHDDCTQSVQSLSVDSRIGLHSLQITALKNKVLIKVFKEE